MTNSPQKMEKEKRDKLRVYNREWMRNKRKAKVGMTREICKRCFRQSCIGFTVPNPMWRKATKRKWNVLCIQCFDDLCDEQWEFAAELYPVSKKTHQLWKQQSKKS